MVVNGHGESATKSVIDLRTLKSRNHFPKLFVEIEHILHSHFLHARTTDSKIFMYPVQRQRFPAKPLRISAKVGFGVRSSRFTAARTIPGVQMPHCAPPHSMNACC